MTERNKGDAGRTRPHGGKSNDVESLRRIVAHVARRTFTPLPASTAGALSEPVAWSVKHISQNYSQPIRLDEMARRVGLSKYHFLRKFQKELGMTPGAFLQRYRICRAMDRLLESDEAIQTIAREVGYQDAASFSRAFLRTVGTQPYLYRQTRRGRFV